MTVGLGQLDSLYGMTVAGNAIASVAFQSDMPVYTPSNTMITANLTGTLTGPGAFPADSATVTAISDSANTLTLTYNTGGIQSSFTWYVIGVSGDSVLLSSNTSSDVANAANAGNTAGLNFQALSLTGSDLVDYETGTTETWNAFSTPVSVAYAVTSYQAGSLTAWSAIEDSAANVQASLDAIQQAVGAGDIGLILLTDGGTPTLTVTEAQLSSDAGALAVIDSAYQLAVTNAQAGDVTAIFNSGGIASVAIADTAANVAANLDTIESYAAKGEIASIALTDGGTPTLGVTETQLSTDAAALATITGAYQLAVSNAAAADVAGLFAANGAITSVAVSDTAADVGANLDMLGVYAAKGELSSITLTDGGTPTLTLSEAQLSIDAAVLPLISGSYQLLVTDVSIGELASTFAVNGVTSVAVSDSAANVDAGLDLLQSYAAKGELSSIALTDGGIPTLTLSVTQLVSDQAALNEIASPFILSVAAPEADATIAGLAGHGTTIVFSGDADTYTVTPAGDGVDFSITNGVITDQLSGVTALQFSDLTEFVASQTPATPGGVSSAQMASLYAAVLDRTPDVAGLAYYEAVAANNPTLPITVYAVDFLSSPEYTSNSAHNYAPTPSGDAQFITDTYNNLLHRGPAVGDVAWYQANVIAPFLAGQTAGTAGYAAAELQAHAAVLADFSQSAEFISDVQVTAQHPADAQHWLVLV